MSEVLGLSPTFTKGIAVVVAAFIVFIGSVYVLLSAYFGPRMGYLVLAVSFFGWMIIFSALWTFGAPGTPKNLGPRGTEPHWEVFAAGAGPMSTEYPNTERFPEGWVAPDQVGQLPEAPPTSVDPVVTAIQEYLAERANAQLGAEAERAPGETEGEEAFRFLPANFTVENVRFSTAPDGTPLAVGDGFYSLGGPRLTVFVRWDTGNVPVYSWAFLGASIFGFLVHLPFLDRAERPRKAILTGGTAPPWYGPA